MQLTRAILAIAMVASTASALPKADGATWNNPKHAAQVTQAHELAKPLGQTPQSLELSSLSDASSDKRNLDSALAQQDAGQGLNLIRAERYHQQAVGQAKYFTENNERQQRETLRQEVSGSVTAQQSTPNRMPAASQLGSSASEQGSVWQQQAREPQSVPQQQQRQDVHDPSQFNMASNIASASQTSANPRVRQVQGERLGLAKQQLNTQEEQASQTEQQVQQIQQMLAESELMTCLRAAMGNLHQCVVPSQLAALQRWCLPTNSLPRETICMTSRYSREKGSAVN
ncbi:hypothetical protein BT67DRAFT_266608 [Trichocladium antarcticum]|uniref:Uncharacterized protein n=1 Tax=Trichocladium antarcticum TaxID=1450529 RepID=A0AAN6UNC7_9PEZI|nr:hypothetical protein BT67DRAFT_266608 [Trichocladium antarcticum]